MKRLRRRGITVMKPANVDVFTEGGETLFVFKLHNQTHFFRYMDVSADLFARTHGQDVSALFEEWLLDATGGTHMQIHSRKDGDKLDLSAAQRIGIVAEIDRDHGMTTASMGTPDSHVMVWEWPSHRNKGNRKN